MLTVRDMKKILDNFDPNRPVAVESEYFDLKDGVTTFLNYDINIQLDIDTEDEPIVVISSQ